MKAFRNQRVIKAPPEKVFAAIEDPSLLARWWGPAGFTCTFELFEFKPGGRWKFLMHGPDGTVYPNESIFREVERPRRVVIAHVVDPLFTATIEVEACDVGSRLNWVQAFEDEEVAKAMAPIVEPANEQVFDKLQALVEGSR